MNLYRESYRVFETQYERFLKLENENRSKGELPWPRYFCEYDNDLKNLTNRLGIDQYLINRFGNRKIKVLDLFSPGEFARRKHNYYGVSLTAKDYRDASLAYEDQVNDRYVLGGNFYNPLVFSQVKNAFFSIDENLADVLLCIPVGGFSDIDFFECGLLNKEGIHEHLFDLYIKKLEKYLSLLSYNGVAFVQIPRVINKFIYTDYIKSQLTPQRDLTLNNIEYRFSFDTRHQNKLIARVERASIYS